jgi:hypothetical protein
MYSPKRRFRLFRDPAWAGGGDAIAESLTTSLSAYNSASDGSWIKITSDEYTELQSNVGSTSVAGATASTMTAIGTSTNFTVGSLIFTNVVSAATPAIPANSYVYAVSFYFNGTNSTVSVYANDSTSSYTNFTKVGATLPTTTAGLNYYVLKGSSTTTASSDGNLAMWHNTNVSHGFRQSIGAAGVRHTSTATPSSSSTLSSTFGNASAFSLQALTTTSKQW